MANALDFTVSAYSINSSTGALRPVAGSPFPTGAYPGSVAVDPSGRFAYVTNACLSLDDCSSGEWKNKDEAIKDTEAKLTKTASSEVTDMKVMTFGSKVAVAHYKMTYDATMGATHRARSVICSDTWMDESGAWKVISNHCSHIEGT